MELHCHSFDYIFISITTFLSKFWEVFPLWFHLNLNFNSVFNSLLSIFLRLSKFLTSHFNSSGHVIFCCFKPHFFCFDTIGDWSVLVSKQLPLKNLVRHSCSTIWKIYFKTILIHCNAVLNSSLWILTLGSFLLNDIEYSVSLYSYHCCFSINSLWNPITA